MYFMRLKNSFLTMLSGIISIVIIGILGFVKTRYFINLLGSEANGLIQMIYRILSYLSLAEFGLGGALIYKLYKPLAENDKEKISQIISTANYFFKRIGIAILIFLLVFMFVVPFLIKGDTFSNIFLYAVFILAGLPYAIEYIWYKKYYILIAADQKQYLNNIIFNGSTIIYDIFIIIALFHNINVIQYILISYPFIIVKGLALNYVYKKNYSYITKTKILDKESISMSKDVFIHNIGSSINNSADQLILSAFKGLTFVSIYTSYFYIVKYLKDITGSILKSTLYSFGNLFAKEDDINGKSYDIFKEFLVLSSFLSVVISVTFYLAIKPFINMWINDPTYILSIIDILAFTWLVYINIITIPINIASGANGVFKQTKYYSFIATIVNVVLSFLLINKYQIAGIVFATCFSTMFIWFSLTLKVIYKEIFNKHKAFDYWKQIIKSSLFALIIIALIEVLNLVNFYTNTIANWILLTTIFFILTTLIIGIIYYVSDDFFKKFLSRCIRFMKRRKDK